MRLTWKARLTPITKIRLVAIFTTTLVTTAVSLYFVYVVIRIGSITEAYAGTVHVGAALCISNESDVKDLFSCKDGVSLLVANLPVILTFSFRLRSNASSTPDAHDGQAFDAVKRTPPRSFPFLSAITTVGQHSTPAHIHIRIDRADDRCLVKVEDTRKDLRVHASQTLTDIESLQMKDIAAKTPAL